MPVTADVFGSRRALDATPLSTYITPEQIKDDLERFCADPAILTAFYDDICRDVRRNAAVAAEVGLQHGAGDSAGEVAAGGGNGEASAKEQKKRNGSTTGASSSSLLRPVLEAEIEDGDGDGDVDGMGEGALGMAAIPEMRLPESVQRAAGRGEGWSRSRRE
jgi:hypothetical protein